MEPNVDLVSLDARCPKCHGTRKFFCASPRWNHAEEFSQAKKKDIKGFGCFDYPFCWTLQRNNIFQVPLSGTILHYGVKTTIQSLISNSLAIAIKQMKSFFLLQQTPIYELESANFKGLIEAQDYEKSCLTT